MTTYLLSRKQTIARPLAEVSAFFERPENLARITPPWLGFRLHSASPVAMRAGATIDYSIRVMKVWVRWRTLIESYEPPRSFTDSQLRGPYKLWRHSHFFREAPGGTEIEDRVEYAVGWGPLGAAAHAIYVRRSLEEIFDYRAAATKQILEGER